MLRSLPRFVTRASTSELARRCLNASRISHRATQPPAVSSFSALSSALSAYVRASVAAISTSSVGQDKTHENSTGAIFALLTIAAAASTGGSMAFCNPPEGPPLPSSQTTMNRRSARVLEAVKARQARQASSSSDRKRNQSHEYLQR